VFHCRHTVIIVLYLTSHSCESLTERVIKLGLRLVDYLSTNSLLNFFQIAYIKHSTETENLSVRDRDLIKQIFAVFGERLTPLTAFINCYVLLN